MSANWKQQPGADLRVHVYPLNDLHEHDVGSDLCPCIPITSPGNSYENPIVRHNSYDGREVGEVCRKALDMLGVQKPPPWSVAERNAYEHAIQVLGMHWPFEDGEENERGTSFPFRPKPKDIDIP